MTSKADLIRQLETLRGLEEKGWEEARATRSAQYEAERAHEQQINQIIDVLGLRNTYRMVKRTDGTFDITGVAAFLADIQAAANAIESAEAKKRLGIYQVRSEED